MNAWLKKYNLEQKLISAAAVTLIAITTAVSFIYETSIPPDGHGTMDSVAIWVAPDPDSSRLFLTDKTRDYLEMHNAVTNTYIGRIGGTGSADGQLLYPNGVAVAYDAPTHDGPKDVVLAVERDNNRVSIFALPENTFLGSFGQSELDEPYGIAIHEENGSIQAWITSTNTSPNKVFVYDLEPTATGTTGKLNRSFETEGFLESIVVDPFHHEVYLCDESGPRNVMIYDLDGNLKGRFGDGLFVDDPEGIAIYDMGSGSGWIIVSDQNASPTQFEVFERGTLTHVGHFTGQENNTDGLTLTQFALPNLPNGSFFPIHSDRNARAYDWADIANGMGLGIKVLSKGPAAPTNLAASAVSENQIDLNWTDNSDDEDGFKLERKLGSGAFSEIATLTAGTTSYSDTALIAATAYDYRIKAYNSEAASGYSNVALATTLGEGNNVLPTAVAEATPTSGLAPLTVNFTGSNSTDSDGTISTYSWNFGDGNSSSSADPSHTYNNAGTYNAVLTVTDDGGATDTDQVTITANGAANQPPVPVISSPTAGQSFPSGSTVNFSGSATDPEDGTLGASTAVWTINGPGIPPDYVLATGTFSTSGTATSDGNYTVSLEVEDSQGLTGSTTTSFSVGGAGNQSPTAVAEASPTSGTVPLTVNFTGSNSSDPDGTISSYSWDFGDGGSSPSADPSHTYNSTGTFNAVLTVTDNDGATDTDQVSITVNGAGNTPPVATVTSPGDGASFSVGATVNYSGTGTDAEDGTLGGSAFTWFYSRNGGPDVQFASGVTGGSIPATAPGTYDVILEVEDSQGATDRDEVTITVSGSAKAGVLVAGLGTMEYMTLSVMPEGYKLHEPYPNPFNPTTRIAFDLPSAETVSLRIFNSLGRDQQFGAGTHQAVWDARDNTGNRVPSGNYYLRIDAGPLHAMKKLSLLK